MEIEVLFKIGLRFNELLTMTTDDIMGDILKVIWKRQKEAHVFLPASLREAFRKYMQARRSRGTNRVLVSGQDKSLTYDGLRQEIY